MAIYRVFQHPGQAASTAVFVKEGFSGAAMIFSLFWALWNRLWIVAAVLFAIIAGYGLLAGVFRFGEEIAAIANLAFGLMLGWEAENLRSWSLLRAGFRETGIVQGKDIDEAELKFFMDQPAQFVSPETAALKYRPAPQPDTLGLFGNA